MAGILKLAGTVLALAGGYGIGWRMAYRKKQRILLLQELQQILMLLYGRVEYSADDMVEVLEDLSGKTAYFSSFLKGTSYEMGLRSGKTLYQLWQENISKSPALTGLMEQEDLVIWQELGQHLGTLDRQTQLHAIRILEKRTAEQIKEAAREYHSQSRVYRVVGTTMGIFTIILLW